MPLCSLLLPLPPSSAMGSIHYLFGRDGPRFFFACFVLALLCAHIYAAYEIGITPCSSCQHATVNRAQLRRIGVNTTRNEIEGSECFCRAALTAPQRAESIYIWPKKGNPKGRPSNISILFSLFLHILSICSSYGFGSVAVPPAWAQMIE